MLPWVDVATGSLGQGLPISTGIASAPVISIGCRTASGACAATPRWPKARSGKPSSTPAWPGSTTSSRSSMSTGSVSAARRCTAGISTPMPSAPRPVVGTRSKSTATTSPRSTSAYAEAEATSGSPTMVVARTIKGYWRHRDGQRRGQARPAAQGSRQGHPGARRRAADPRRRRQAREPRHPAQVRCQPPVRCLATSSTATRCATRKAFGEGLAALMRRRGDVAAIDGEVGNSTYLEEVLKDTPDRYFEAYIAEQMMIATAVGFQVRGWTPFAATFAAFSRGPMTSCAWGPSPRPSCASTVRTPVSRSAKTARHRWRSRIWPSSARWAPRWCSIPATQPDREAGGRDGRLRRDLLPALDALGLPDAVRARRGVQDRRLPGGARVR